MLLRVFFFWAIAFGSLSSLAGECEPGMMLSKTEFSAPQRFSIRGIGTDETPGDFVTGGDPGLHHNISAFVENQRTGELIVKMFGGRGAWLDFRSEEPRWVQVKVGATDENLPRLHKLRELVEANNDMITPEIIQAARTASFEDPSK